jgi:hypothetical protein
MYGVRIADLGFRLRVNVRATNARGTGNAASITNDRPALRIISIRFVGNRVYARFRICDDDGADTRNWVPARRFRGPGRYTITLRTRDTAGVMSPPARRTFFRR